MLRDPTLLAVVVAQAQIPIPNRFHLDFASAVFLIKSAEAKSVDVLGRFHEQMIIDERVLVDKGAEPCRGICKIRPIERCFEAIHIILQPRPLNYPLAIRKKFFGYLPSLGNKQVMTIAAGRPLAARCRS